MTSGESMAWRDLTEAFVQLRSGENADMNLQLNLDIISEKIDSGLSENDVETANFQALRKPSLPEWMDKMDLIKATATKIESKYKELIELQAKRIMTNQDLEETIWPQGVNIQTRDLVFLFMNAENLLKLFEKESDRKGVSGPEKTIRTNVQHSLAKKLQGLNMAFRSTQKEYLSRLQRQTSGVQEEDPDLFEDQGLKQEHLFAMERADAEVKERDVEIRKTAQSIEELYCIFKELATLVIDQDTIPDRIDYNLEHPNGYTYPPPRPCDMHPSKRHCCMGRKKRKHFVCCYLLIAILLIVLVVKKTPKSK